MRLRFHALRRIHDQEGAPSQAARLRLTSWWKSTCPGRIDQVEDVVIAVESDLIIQPHRVALDRDAAFALEVHGVQELLFHVPRGHGSCPSQAGDRPGWIFPWSMCAMMQKFRILPGSMAIVGSSRSGRGIGRAEAAESEPEV